MTVYRELSAELQSTRAKLALMEIQNEQLTEQNLKLRAELEPILQASQNIHQLLHPVHSSESGDLRTDLPAERPPLSLALEPQPAPTSLQATVAAIQAQATKPPEKPKATVSVPQPQADTAEPGTLSGSWLILTMILVVVTSFGAGYLLMRPLMNQR
jgi:hypothetical protein